MRSHYIIQVNCKAVKAGTIPTEREEIFEQEMTEKYSGNGMNLVQVLYR